MAEDVTGSLVSVRIDFLCPTVVACDFFTVCSSFGKTLYVLFLIELSSRRVHLAGCTARPGQRLGHPAGEKLRDGARRRRQRLFASSSTTETRSSPLPSTGSSARMGSGSSRPGPSATSKGRRRALGQVGTDRGSRLAAHPRRAPPQNDPSRIRRSLQPRSATPITRS